VALQGNNLLLILGFSHPVEFKAVPGITFKVEKNMITVSGIDKEAVGQTAANIRKIRKPEPYKGKGIHYLGEVIKRKAGKKAVKGSF
jgi:large subunit ribosomal protein L6